MPNDAIASLSVARVAGNADATKHLVMLHGIYGRGRNWQGIARALTASRDDYICWLVDLPHHGDSGAGTHGDTVHGLAADLADWVAAQQVTATAVLGHSYGGKVALALAQRLADQPLQIWVIDSSPEVKEPAGSAWTMLEVIRRLPARFATRDEAVAALVAAGYPVGVAQWMSTNLIREDNDFVWRLDFATMERLLNDFFTTDLWAVIETPAPQHEIHVVKASESNAITADAVRRLELAADARMHLHHRPGGHWLHAESPEVVTRLLIEHLP